MSSVFLWLVIIPTAVMAIRFWVGVAQWLLRHKRTLHERIERVRSAFAEES